MINTYQNVRDTKHEKGERNSVNWHLLCGRLNQNIHVFSKSTKQFNILKVKYILTRLIQQTHKYL